jgi:hypothetical protein
MNSANEMTLSEVLGAAYPGNNTKHTLVHAVVNGSAVCGKVKDEHLAEYANPIHTQPTCARCLKAWTAAQK